MVNEQVLTVSLEEFGLSKYEAQAYVALISKGTISASELAYYSEIPRTKIYPTLPVSYTHLTLPTNREV